MISEQEEHLLLLRLGQRWKGTLDYDGAFVLLKTNLQQNCKKVRKSRKSTCIFAIYGYNNNCN